MMTLKTIVTHSVFRRLLPGTPMDTVLATLFHRSAATMYGIYTLWAIVAFITGIIPIIDGFGTLIGRVIFPALILITAALSGIGASFWPNMARLELFAGSSFVMALIIYIVYIGARVVSGESGSSWAGFIIATSYLVIPTARTVLVIILLLRQAEERKLQGD
jgi:hypothetical protein